MNKISIFIDCHVFDKGHQGTTTYLKGLYTELIKEERIHFYFGTTNSENLKKVFGEQKNITYVLLNSSNKFYRLLIDIPRIIKKNNIDFAHFQYIIPPIKRCNYIVTIHDILFMDYPKYFPLSYRLKNKFLFKWSAKKADIVLTVSNFSKEQLVKHFQISNTTITPNAVDPIFFESYNKKEIKQSVFKKHNLENYFIYISRWEPRKNHETLLMAFVKGEFYKNHSLVFVGDKDLGNKKFDIYFDNLPLHIKEKVVILNKVNFEDLVQFIRAADVSIYPSFAEGFGIPPLESLAAGVPTICSNTSAMKDFDFFENYQFNPLDENQLIDKIHQALKHNDTQQQREKMRQKYNWNKTANQFLKAISFLD